MARIRQGCHGNLGRCAFPAGRNLVGRSGKRRGVHGRGVGGILRRRRQIKASTPLRRYPCQPQTRSFPDAALASKKGTLPGVMTRGGGIRPRLHRSAHLLHCIPIPDPTPVRRAASLPLERN